LREPLKIGGVRRAISTTLCTCHRSMNSSGCGIEIQQDILVTPLEKHDGHDIKLVKYEHVIIAGILHCQYLQRICKEELDVKNDEEHARRIYSEPSPMH